LPLAECNALHNNDGTLWPENAMPFQAAFAIDDLMQVLALTYAGMTIDEFRDALEAWFTSAKHPRFGRRL
jgi:hypothetical protein